MGLFKYLKEKFKGKKEQEEIREKYVAGLEKAEEYIQVRCADYIIDRKRY